MTTSRWSVFGIYFSIVKRDNRNLSRGQNSYVQHSWAKHSWAKHLRPTLCTVQLRRDIIDVLYHKYLMTWKRTAVSKHPSKVAYSRSLTFVEAVTKRGEIVEQIRFI